MRKLSVLLIFVLCVNFMFAGCSGQIKMRDLVNTVNENPGAYFGDYYYELEYISSEYIAENDAYFLIYQGKFNERSMVQTYNLKACFYNSDGEWILDDYEREHISTYLDIAGTNWEAIPKKGWDHDINVGEDIKVLDVSEDSERLSIMLGSEKIEFIRRHVDNVDTIRFNYDSEGRSEPILLQYDDPSTFGEPRILLWFGNNISSNSNYGTQDLKYTLKN